MLKLLTDEEATRTLNAQHILFDTYATRPRSLPLYFVNTMLQILARNISFRHVICVSEYVDLSCSS